MKRGRVKENKEIEFHFDLLTLTKSLSAQFNLIDDLSCIAGSSALVERASSICFGTVIIHDDQ